jgi:hypothetical protein
LSIVKRLTFALCATWLAACSAPGPAPFVFPQSAGPWKLKQTREVAGGSSPESIRRLGLKRAQAAEYEGPGRIAMEVYELTSSAAAFEAEQQWRPLADTVAFHRESYFVVVHWESTDRIAVKSFVREMEDRVGR